MPETNEKYKELLAKMKDALFDASETTSEPMAPMMILADLTTDLLSDQFTGEKQTFLDVMDLYFRRIEINIDAAITAKFNPPVQ